MFAHVASVLKGKDMKSEHTKSMSDAEIKDLREEVSKMNEEQLAEFRNGFDPDEMGFHGEEGEIE